MSDTTTARDTTDDHPYGPEWNDVCHECNNDCGHEDRGHCIGDECENCHEVLDNCDCEPDSADADAPEGS